MMRKCHLNTCPVGVATQDPELRKKFNGQPEHVVNYFFFVAEEVRELMAKLGIRRFNELIGRSDLLDMRQGIDHWKARGLDFSRIFHQPTMPSEVARFNCEAQDHGLDRRARSPDHRRCRAAAIERYEAGAARIPHPQRAPLGRRDAVGHDRSALRTRGPARGHVHVAFNGIAGQSFGAFLARGVSFELQGATNDYVGKGLSGGRIVVYPDPASPAKPDENIVIGNTVMYGAIDGEAYFRGVAGERFCVRNSGASAVVEGTGDHGCEYMTGGTVVVLGRTGRNFAAGMSGGIAYVYDEDGSFAQRCNTSMVQPRDACSARPSRSAWKRSSRPQGNGRLRHAGRVRRSAAARDDRAALAVHREHARARDPRSLGRDRARASSRCSRTNTSARSANCMRRRPPQRAPPPARPVRSPGADMGKVTGFIELAAHR